jgi:hypothetical protein
MQMDGPRPTRNGEVVCSFPRGARTSHSLTVCKGTCKAQLWSQCDNAFVKLRVLVILPFWVRLWGTRLG